MSTSYYLVKKEELKKKTKIEKNKEKIKERIKKELEKVAEQYNLSEYEKDEGVKNILRKIEYDFLDIDIKDVKICNTNRDRVIFYHIDYMELDDFPKDESNDYLNYHRERTGIHDIRSLKEFFEKNKEEYVIIDEYHKKFLTWESFIRAIRYRNFKKQEKIKWRNY